MKKILINGGGVFPLLVLSLTTKADFPSHSLPVLATCSFTNDDIADKLAGDDKFAELISLFSNTESKIRSLSLDDKQLFKKYTEEKNIIELSKLYTKCGIDYKEVSSKKMAIVIGLDKKYELNKRSNKKEIINSAILKRKTPFGDCLMGLMLGALACEAFSGNYYFYCIIAVESAYLGCILALD